MNKTWNKKWILIKIVIRNNIQVLQLDNIIECNINYAEENLYRKCKKETLPGSFFIFEQTVT